MTTPDPTPQTPAPASAERMVLVPADLLAQLERELSAAEEALDVSSAVTRQAVCGAREVFGDLLALAAQPAPAPAQILMGHLAKLACDLRDWEQGEMREGEPRVGYIAATFTDRAFDLLRQSRLLAQHPTTPPAGAGAEAEGVEAGLGGAVGTHNPYLFRDGMEAQREAWERGNARVRSMVDAAYRRGEDAATALAQAPDGCPSCRGKTFEDGMVCCWSCGRTLPDAQAQADGGEAL